jgi:ribosome-associated protein
MQNVAIRTDPVELYKILKFEGLVESGAEAKAVIAAGRVSVNSEVETRKRRKIHVGDVVQFNGQSFRIVAEESSDSR